MDEGSYELFGNRKLSPSEIPDSMIKINGGKNDMNNKKILPIEPHPMSLVFGHIFNPLTIIEAYDGTKEWLLSNYIQLCAPSEYYIYGEEDIEFLNFYPKYFSDFESFYLRTHNLTDSILDLSEEDLIDNIIRWIDNDYYIETFVDESLLPGTYMHKNRIERINEQLIYGYDREAEILKITAFDETDHYSPIDVSFSDFVNAFFAESTERFSRESNWISVGQKYGLMLYRFRKDVKYTFDIRSVIIQLDEYVNGKNSALHLKWLNDEKKGFVFGVKVYDALIQWISLHETEYVDHRTLFGLWDHKRIMLERLKYLEDNGYLDKNREYSRAYSEVELMANKARLLVMKYNVVRKKDVLASITALLRDMREKEQEVLNSVLCELGKKYETA